MRDYVREVSSQFHRPTPRQQVIRAQLIAFLMIALLFFLFMMVAWVQKAALEATAIPSLTT